MRTKLALLVGGAVVASLTLGGGVAMAGDKSGPACTRSAAVRPVTAKPGTFVPGLPGHVKAGTGKGTLIGPSCARLDTDGPACAVAAVPRPGTASGSARAMTAKVPVGAVQSCTAEGPIAAKKK